MGMPVSDLRRILESASKDFVLPAETLGIADAEPLFTDYLSGDLDFADATCDSAELSVAGDLALPGVESGRLPATARFLVDDEGLAVIGVEIIATWPNWHIDMPYLVCDLSSLSRLGFGSAALALSAAPNEEGVLQPGVMAAVAFAGPGRTEHLLMAQQELTGVWRVVGYFADRLTFASLTSLAALPFVDADVLGDAALPEEIQDILSSLFLVSIGGAFDTRTGRFREIMLDLRLDTADWEVLPGVLTLDELRLWLQLMTATAAPDTMGSGAAVAGPVESGPRSGGTVAPAWLRGGFTGRCRLDGGYVLDAAVTFPDAYLTAVVSDPPAGADLIGDALEGTGLPSGVVLRRLAVGCAPRSGVYTLALALDTTWAFAPGLELAELSLELIHGRTGTDATITGTVNLDGAPLALTARRGADGWSVAGAAYGVDLGALKPWFATTFGVPLPECLAGLELAEVHVALNSKPAGSVTLTGTLPTGDIGSRAAFTLTAAVTRDGDGNPSASFAGSLDLVVALDDITYPMRFEMDLDHGDAGTAWSARWEATDRPLPLFAVLRALGLAELGDLEQALPASLRPDLHELAIGYDSATGDTVVSARTELVSLVVASVRDAQGASTWAAQVSVAVRAGVSQLPLLAGLIPPGEDLGLTGVRVVASARPVPPALLDRLNQALAAAAPTSPVLPVLDAQQGGLPGGTWLALEYALPGTTAGLLTVQLSGPRPPAVPGPPSLPQTTGQRVLEGVVLPPGQTPGPPAAEGRAGVWIELGRSFGPLAVYRIGVAYEAGTIWMMVDGALSAAGFTMAVQGLALGVDLNADGFPVRTRLSGLAVDFERPPLRIAGALISQQPPPAGYEMMVGGLLVVQLPRIGVTAVGAYQCREDGMPSLFVFGRATAPIGGPPPFRVTGVAAGFGFNSSLAVPEPSQVAEFPLIRGLNPGGLPDDPMDVLGELTGRWVTPRQGQIWLAAGLDFTSFEFIAGRLLLLLEAGNDLTVALLGTARAAFPRTGRAYAQVNLQLRIVYRSAVGEFAATALLYDSYVIDPSCVLTGGFAFYMWSGDSKYAGDFALTAGGYHRLYSPPAHYPQVPRLGFSWSLGNVDITGSAYFALTPAAVMAGGTLDVSYSSGPLKAWLHASAHMLVSWKPVHFLVEIGVTVGASLKVLFVTLKGELGASLTIWGPPTGGTVTAKFVFITVTIDFGSKRTSPPALDWPQFTELLPPPEQVLRVTMLDGLLADAEPPAGRDLDDPQAPWLVDPGGFTFLAETSVPASELSFQGGATHRGKSLDIRPMRLSGRTSSFTVKVTTEKDARGADLPSRTVERAGEWKVDVVDGDVPTALWGPLDPDEDDIFTGKDRLEDRPTGLKITVPSPVTSGATLGPIPEAAIAYEELPDVDHPRDPGDPPADDLVRPTPSAGAGVSRIAGHIDSDAAQDARTRLRQALDALLAPETDGLPDSPLSDYATRAACDGLPADPLLLAGAGARAHATTETGSRA